MLLEEISGISSPTDPTKVIELREETVLIPPLTNVVETENGIENNTDEYQRFMEPRHCARTIRLPKNF